MDFLHVQLATVQKQLAFVSTDPIDWKTYVQACSWAVCLFESYLLYVIDIDISRSIRGWLVCFTDYVNIPSIPKLLHLLRWRNTSLPRYSKSPKYTGETKPNSRSSLEYTSKSSIQYYCRWGSILGLGMLRKSWLVNWAIARSMRYVHILVTFADVP